MKFMILRVSFFFHRALKMKLIYLFETFLYLIQGFFFGFGSYLYCGCLFSLYLLYSMLSRFALQEVL